MALLCAPLSAQTMMAPTQEATSAPPATNAPAAGLVKTPPPVKVVAAPAPSAPSAQPVKIPPPLPPDTLGQYGKILTPSDQLNYPLKLRMPFPGVGEVKVPSPDELVMRDKLEELAKLSDADIRTKLAAWPAFGKMSLRDEGMMLARIQDFRDYRSNAAKMKAHDMGLLTLLPEQQAKFEKEYWDKRLAMDHDLAKQFAPVMQAAQQKMLDDLYREFSALQQVPGAPAAKPAMASAPTPNKPLVTPPAPVKPATTTATAPPKPVPGSTTVGAATPPMTQATQ